MNHIEEIKTIISNLQFNDESSGIGIAASILSKTRPHIQDLKSTIDTANEEYIETITYVAENVIRNLKIELYRFYEQILYGNDFALSLFLWESFNNCMLRAEKMLDEISLMDTSISFKNTLEVFKTDFYDKNKKVEDKYISITTGKTKDSSEKSGCYIATMVYKDYDHPNVLTLREFRDKKLSKNFLGRIFIRIYYFTSPKFVSVFKNNKRVNSTIRKILDRIVQKIK